MSPSADHVSHELLSWNVAARVGRCGQQLELITARGADIVCLQEVTPTTLGRWQAGLAEAGYLSHASPWIAAPQGSRRLATLTAARVPMTLLDVPGIPWPERHLAVRLHTDAVGEVTVHNVHAPTSFKPERVKARTLAAVHRAALHESTACIVAGDLNTPRYESRDGGITSFARTRAGNLRPALGAEHDRAELALIEDLPSRGWNDAFRAVHGYQRRDRSWLAPPGYGYRLDHILLSPCLRSIDCDYLHEWRELRLSDHSPMWALFTRAA